MDASTDQVGDWASSVGAVTAVILDGDGTVLRWSRSATELLGRTATEACGRPVRELLADDSCAVHGQGTAFEGGIPAAGRTRLRHRSGRAVEVAFRVVRLEHSSDLLVLAATAHRVAEWRQSAVLRALFTQERVGIVLHDTGLTVVRTNVTPEMFGGPPLRPGSRLGEVMSGEDAETTEAALRQVLETGAPLVAMERRMRSPLVPDRQWTLSLSAFRLEDERGNPMGVAALFTDTTAQQRARGQLDLLHEAAARIGGSLDVARTAQDLADVLVPAFGDLATVDLAEAVLDGDEPPKRLGGGEPHQLRAAVAAADGTWPTGLLRPGAMAPVLPDVPNVRAIQCGEAVVSDREGASAPLGDPRLIKMLVPDGGHSVVAAPLYARGLLLGTVAAWRVQRPEPFDADDAATLTEIASRAALSVDNARRYTREHRSVLALQQRLLPSATTESSAGEMAGLYLPAGGGTEVRGDWFDVIPLPSLRVALVVGDVVGHGLPAIATMGRLRTAVQTLADLELDPDELLTHVDDLVQRLAAEAPRGQRDTVGATCLYAVYDPVTCRCVLASAGHPSPLLIRPDGTTREIDVAPGPPLGVGGMPFETITVDLEPGSLLALYTDGLIRRGDHDLDGGLRWLADRLAALCRQGGNPETIGRMLFADLGAHPPDDDIALLLARTRAVPPENTARWEFPADPAAVADARQAAAGQLAIWGLEELGFTTELIVSELVTNAIRYAGGPVDLRLIRENVLVCEVSDPSNTQPRLRRARWTDEGGRGLYLIAQLATRWGSRYGLQGKTIWAEQPLAPAVPGHRSWA
ncbi:SpoIIE family protein phosphatase [Streptomyces flaveolus]|uniref:SpoIIE family protein phosphatase n=1 Tax=Streptomyces flaveolus TaxID=67297 RepID=UPI00381170C3